jgi:5,10-methylenetetrahydromethanopterin reductase
MRLRLGLQAGERLTPRETLELASYCDDVGFESIWVAEGRLTRDAIGPAALIAGRTKRITIGTGVINHKTRNVALTAVTFKTLDEFAPGRIILGIGPWWEPLASKLGLPLNRRPSAELREYVDVIRRLFANETVTFTGLSIQVDRIRFDRTYAENEPVAVPIYLGVVGSRNLELAGEIADGVLLDFLVPTAYTEHARLRLAAGMERRDAAPAVEFQVPQLIACAVDDVDPTEAIDACRAFLTMYLGQQPHIGTHSGIDPELLARVQAELGWPTTLADVKRAMRLVPDALVHSVAACGTTTQVLERLEAYLHAGASAAVLCLLGEHKDEALRRVAAAAA